MHKKVQAVAASAGNQLCAIQHPGEQVVDSTLRPVDTRYNGKVHRQRSHLRPQALHNVLQSRQLFRACPGRHRRAVLNDAVVGE